MAMYTSESEEQLLAGNPDFVLDAIDNIDTKVSPNPGSSGSQFKQTVHNKATVSDGGHSTGFCDSLHHSHPIVSDATSSLFRHL